MMESDEEEQISEQLDESFVSSQSAYPDSVNGAIVTGGNVTSETAIVTEEEPDKELVKKPRSKSVI